MSAVTVTIESPIGDDLTALTDKPAATAQPGVSGQWQMLQPAGQPPAPPEAQLKGVSASNDLWIGALRLPRSSSLTKSGGLRPADPPAGPVHKGPISSLQGKRFLQSTRHALGSLMSGATAIERPCPSHGPTIMARTQTRSAAHVLVEQLGEPFWPFWQKPSLASPSGRARAQLPFVSSRQSIHAPEGREPIEHKRRSQR